MLPTSSLLCQYEAFDTKDLQHAHIWSKLADHINSEYSTLIKYRALPQVELVKTEPYASLSEMRRDFVRYKRLKVSELHCEHPIFSRRTNSRFRILHDIVHCILNVGFDEQGEYETFVHQSHGLPQEIRRALYTEIVIQASYKIHFGEFPAQKLFLAGEGAL
jgi:hypothetical protein